MTRPAGLGLALVTAAFSVACGRPEPAVVTRPLEQGWEFRVEPGAAGTPAPIDTAWLPATVPGTVHTDLLAAGLIPDPFDGTVEPDLQWIEDRDWSYRASFDVDARTLRQDRVELLFQGLDTYASVRLNGTPVLEADNQFRAWRVDVTDALRPGANILEVRFASPVRRGAELASAAPWPIPHQEPDPRGTRAFTRKAAYQYGWDWGPRYVTSGFWKPVRLEAWSGVRLRDVHVVRQTIREEEAVLTLRAEIETTEAGEVKVGAHSPDGSFAPVVARTHVAPGVDTVELTVRIARPRLWWPRGLGEPYLYDMDVDVTKGRRWDRTRLHVGLRTLELVREPDSLGESFFFRVNGRPFFARGANVVPPDHFTPRADSARWARLLHDAVAAHMNMVRVWGGGIYPPDVFYDLADRLGILVWQDFMFANTLVPGDSAFAVNVAEEAAQQVRRLRNHPSLALWCGNNEVAEGWESWGWQDAYEPETQARVAASYARIFGDVLPGVIATHDPGRPYWPSSPSIGWGRPESLTRGDSHYWGVWWGLEPFRAYADKPPRFASEFGFQALPDPVTVATFSDLAAHQKHPTGYRTIRTYLERDWPVPPLDSVDAFGYVSQLAQAEGVGLALEAHRRSFPRTGGTLYWQLDDTWPVVSWSSVDYFGRWKALHYRARDVFAPVAVLADVDQDTARVWVVSDEPAMEGWLEVRTVDATEGVTASERVRVAAGAGPVWERAVSDLVPEERRARTVVEARVIGDGGVVSRDVASLVPPGHLRLPPPGLRVVRAEASGSAWKVTLTATALAYGVRLSLDAAAGGVGARFSDNYFHLMPGDTITVILTPESPVPDLPARLRLRSLADVPR